MTCSIESKTHDLTASFDYQADGIVSRVLLKQPAGSVTAFAFDAGQELSEHTCPFDALVCVIEGEGTITIGGEAHAVAAGQAVKLPAHVSHAVRAPRRFKMLLVMLRAEN